MNGPVKGPVKWTRRELPDVLWKEIRGIGCDELLRAIKLHRTYEEIILGLKRWTDHGNMPKFDSLFGDSTETFGSIIEKAIAKAHQL